MLIFLKTSVLFSLLFSFNATSYQSYNLGAERINISDESFRRVIRPELQAIIREYYSVLKQIIPFCDELIKIKQILLSLNMDWQDWSKRCQQIDYECTVELRQFYKKTRELDQRLFTIQKEELNFSKAKSEQEINAMVYSTQALSEISNSNYHIMHFVEQFLMTANTSYFRSLTNSELFIPILNQMLLTSEMMITEQVGYRYKKEFEFIWNEFTRSAERYAVLGGDKKFFIRKLEDYNISWNEFHMRALKSDIELPPNAQKIIAHIHTRWTLILKHILKTP